jgi:hypothetical protein
MRTKRTLLIAAIAALVLVGAVGAGIAKAVSGSDETVSGPAATKAAAAAVKAAGGGKALEVELQDDGAGVYEVEVRREDGSQIEAHLDAQFQSVGTAADDDTGSGSEEDGSSDD